MSFSELFATFANNTLPIMLISAAEDKLHSSLVAATVLVSTLLSLLTLTPLILLLGK